MMMSPAGANNGQQVERPFKGSALVVLSVDPSCDLFAGACPFTTADAGTASHMGKIATSSEGFVILTGPCVLSDGVTGGVGFATSGTFAHSAANGDQVFGTFENSGCAGLAPGTEDIPGSINGSQEITGGTGRFAGASGSTITFGDGLGPFNWVGTITY